ncbi:MAG: DMT family transporter [Flammeovirgaceae bacterium]
MPTSSKSISGIIAICVATTFWGLDGVVLTPRLYNLDVAFVVFVLHALPFLLMHTFLWKSYRFLRVLKWTDIITIFLVGLFGGALGTLSIVKALFLVNFQALTVVVLLQKLQPVFAITLAFFLLKERPNKNFLAWAVLAIISGYFLTFGWDLPNFHTGENTVYAALFALLAAVSFGTSTVLGRKLLLKFPSPTTSFFRYGATSIIMLIYVSAIGQLDGFQEMTVQNWQIIFLIMFTSGSAMLFLYYYGLKRVQAKVATIAELCFPLSAIVFDYLFNDHALSVVQWLGAVVMIYSMIQIGKRESKAPQIRS